MRRSIASTVAAAFVFCLAGSLAEAADPADCGSGSYAVVGRLAGAATGMAARVGVLPDSPIGERYLGELRTILAARRSPDNALKLVVQRAEFASTATAALGSMRRAVVGEDGRFRCGGLAAGRYLAIAFVSLGTGAQHAGLDPRTMQIFAASASVGAHYDAAIVGWTNLGGTP